MGRDVLHSGNGAPRNSRLKPLAAAFVAVFAWAGREAQASTWTVDTANGHCGDGGGASGQGDLTTMKGTLRFATYFADSNDTVNVLCSTVTLTQGSLYLTQPDLTIKGVAANNLVIMQSAKDRVLNHIGTGTLSLHDMTLTGGYYYLTIGAYGGGIYSKGSVALYETAVVECQTVSNGGDAHGGGVFVKGNLSMTSSSIGLNSATASNHSGVNARGGGAFVQGNFTAGYSTILGNLADIPGTNQGRGGGLYLGGNVTIASSTISGNSAGEITGGVHIASSNAASLVAHISNSTISGNYATYLGGLYVNSGTVEIDDSTIAFNTATKGKKSSTIYAAGMVADSNVAAMSVTLQSSIIANNTYGTSTQTPNDLSLVHTSSHAITFNAAPANNLIFATTAAVPSDTLKSVCPLLGPLRYNGGPTQTHALLSGSPALAAGNNVADFTFDQRGADYLRVSTGESVADIGAYEVQRTDIIFDTGFETCQ
jgi:hypothetical protein